MTGVLISTLWNKLDSTKLSIREFNIQKIIFLIDKTPKQTQIDNINMLKDIFRGMVDITEKNVEEYDVVSISRVCLKIIESIPKTEKIYVDISQAKKPQALGLLFACYARPKNIESIVYWGEDKQMNTLPKLLFQVLKNAFT